MFVRNTLRYPSAAAGLAVADCGGAWLEMAAAEGLTEAGSGAR